MENWWEECKVKYTSKWRNSSCDASLIKSVIKQPTKRPKGMISSWFLESENMTSDKELKMNNVIRVHFNPFCPRKISRSSRIPSAFFHGISLTESGMTSHSFFIAILICILNLFGSLNSFIDTFIEHVGKVWWWTHDLECLCNWPWKCLICTKSHKILFWIKLFGRQIQVPTN